MQRSCEIHVILQADDMFGIRKEKVMGEVWRTWPGSAGLPGDRVPLYSRHQMLSPDIKISIALAAFLCVFLVQTHAAWCTNIKVNGGTLDD